MKNTTTYLKTNYAGQRERQKPPTLKIGQIDLEQFDLIIL